MTKFYATTDADVGYIEENAHIAKFDTREEAVAYLESAYRDGLDDGETIEIASGSFGDCWIKSHSKPAVGDSLISPFTFNDVMVQRPGQHPGGKVYWLTPRPTVLVATIKSE